MGVVCSLQSAVLIEVREVVALRTPQGFGRPRIPGASPGESRAPIPAWSILMSKLMADIPMRG